MSNFFHKFLAGFCMGIAEITPGISGATIAGLFNVYKDFIKVLSTFNPNSLRLNLKYFLDGLNPMFTFPLGIGMLISIYFSAFFIDFLINNYLFIFKIFLSFVMVIAVVKNCFLDHPISLSKNFFVSFIFGVLIALVIAFSLVDLNFNNVFLVLVAGLLAFTAFLLPGISGSLVLVILGLYELIISYIKNLDLLGLLPFIIGMLLSFLFIPKQIINRFQQNEIQLKVFFSGLIMGSVPAVWLHLN